MHVLVQLLCVDAHNPVSPPRKIKHMLSAISCPLRNKAMIRVIKRSTSTYGYKPKVLSLFKNDLFVHNKPLLQNIILGELMDVSSFCGY